jgi:hypothetical protein
MKSLLIIITSILLCGCNVDRTNLPITNHRSNKMCYVLDLPEEYEAISKDKDKPDLLVAHLSGDTLYLRFDN